MMILKNGLVFTQDARFEAADVELADGKIVRVAPAGTLHGDEELDATGKYVTPVMVTAGSTGITEPASRTMNAATVSRRTEERATVFPFLFLIPAAAGKPYLVPSQSKPSNRPVMAGKKAIPCNTAKTKVISSR